MGQDPVIWMQNVTAAVDYMSSSTPTSRQYPFMVSYSWQLCIRRNAALRNVNSARSDKHHNWQHIIKSTLNYHRSNDVTTCVMASTKCWTHHPFCIFDRRVKIPPTCSFPAVSYMLKSKTRQNVFAYGKLHLKMNVVALARVKINIAPKHVHVAR